MQVRQTKILAELPSLLVSRKRPWLIAGISAISLFGVVAATAVVPQASPAAPFSARPVIETLAMTPISVDAPSELPFVHDDRILPGDTLPAIFRRLGINDPDALAFIQSDAEGSQALRQMRAGRSITAMISSEGKLVSLSLPLVQGGNRFTIEREEESQTFRVRTQETAALETVVEMRTGTIRHSLFGATDAVGLPDNIATKLAELFGTEIDFHTDLRKGDTFSVVYETVYDQGSVVRTGRVLAAEFVNQGKRAVVVLHEGPGGKEQYYSGDGRSLRQAFLRSPLEFSRVTSGFGRRLHPIHKSWRSHNGVDFAAPTGTPIKATSDGVVTFVGTQGGYGNIVILRHRGKLTTAYAHLNGFARNIKQGMSVDQGEVIGYVGSTGWATGPHLHYEVRVDNVAQDPLRIALPMANTLEGKELAQFRKNAAPLLQRIALMNYSTTNTLASR
ncbi:MAG: M23 family metallopeptidase [Azoarcus sp.]|nr:M23 family metallopeptidase [Azoarcus sp.]